MLSIESIDAETRSNGIELSDGFESIVQRWKYHIAIFNIELNPTSLHHFTLFDMFSKRFVDVETRCNEDIDLSDGFESTVHTILEYWKVYKIFNIVLA